VTKLNPLKLLQAAALWIVLGSVLESPALAQPYPTKQIRLIVPSVPGSPPDIRARWLADRLGPALGQPIIVDNKAGAAGNIGMEAAARSPADGYTLILVHAGLVINPHMYSRPGYDPLADFAPITRLSMNGFVLVVDSRATVNSVAELIRLARQKPGHLTYGSGGRGSPPHMAGELFKRATKIDVLHVPYKGALPALTDLTAGRISYMIDNPAIMVPQVKNGNVKALAVTGAKRIASLPEVPTAWEAGIPDYEFVSWMGLCATARTPRSIVSRLNQAVLAILDSTQAREWFAAQGSELKGDTPEEFAIFLKSEYAKWGLTVRDAKLLAD
jgi:tripartite-type tricarboxylate transporter receptor subunit TctC